MQPFCLGFTHCLMFIYLHSFPTLALECSWQIRLMPLKYPEVQNTLLKTVPIVPPLILSNCLQTYPSSHQSPCLQSAQWCSEGKISVSGWTARTHSFRVTVYQTNEGMKNHLVPFFLLKQRSGTIYSLQCPFWLKGKSFKLPQLISSQFNTS